MDALKEQTRKDLIAFFESQGGHTRVAEHIGLAPQTLRNIKTGRNDVTLSILVAISQAYPDSAEARLLLARSVGLDAAALPTPNQPTPTNGTDWKARFDALESRYDALMGNYQTLLTKYESLFDRVVKKLDLSFNSADSQFTAFASTEPIGFKTYNAPVPAARKWAVTIHKGERTVFGRYEKMSA